MAGLAGGCLLFTGCGVAVPPLAAAPASAAPSATAAPVASPPASAAVARPAFYLNAPASPPLVLPPALAEPLPPLSRPFVSVTLPGIRGMLASVSGRSSQDLWFLSDEETAPADLMSGAGVVFHYDGKKVKSYGQPCARALFGSVAVSKDSVLAMGSRPWTRGVWPHFRAALLANGKWDCYGDTVVGGLTVSSGDHLWKASCVGDPWLCHIEVEGGPAIALPFFDGSFRDREAHPPEPLAMAMRAADDGWMVLGGDDSRQWLVHYNGVTWEPRAGLDEGLEVVDLWVDGEGHVWMTARRGKQATSSVVQGPADYAWETDTHSNDNAEANLILRFDGHTLSALAVPASFKTQLVRGSGPQDVWFVGLDRTVYQWDGTQLRQGEAPLLVLDAWMSPGGELWLVGSDAEIDEKGEVKKPMTLGLVAHTAALPGPGAARAGVKQ
jgi:hypothetical protein